MNKFRTFQNVAIHLKKMNIYFDLVHSSFLDMDISYWNCLGKPKIKRKKQDQTKSNPNSVFMIADDEDICSALKCLRPTGKTAIFRP